MTALTPAERENLIALMLEFEALTQKQLRMFAAWDAAPNAAERSWASMHEEGGIRNRLQGINEILRALIREQAGGATSFGEAVAQAKAVWAADPDDEHAGGEADGSASCDVLCVSCGARDGELPEVCPRDTVEHAAPPAPCGHAELLRDLRDMHAAWSPPGDPVLARIDAALADGPCEWETVTEWPLYRLDDDGCAPGGERIFGAVPGELHLEWRHADLRDGDRVVVFRRRAR